jgi:hypothetical protein
MTITSYALSIAFSLRQDDAASAEEIDWPQILAWYDDLVALTPGMGIRVETLT